MTAIIMSRPGGEKQHELVGYHQMILNLVDGNSVFQVNHLKSTTQGKDLDIRLPSLSCLKSGVSRSKMEQVQAQKKSNSPIRKTNLWPISWENPQFHFEEA